MTKQGLGKVVPAVGVLVGGTLNWTTLEGIVDTADMAYRRRFLLDKYPHLDDGAAPEPAPGDASKELDQTISVLDVLAEEGRTGPALTKSGLTAAARGPRMVGSPPGARQHAAAPSGRVIILGY